MRAVGLGVPAEAAAVAVAYVAGLAWQAPPPPIHLHYAEGGVAQSSHGGLSAWWLLVAYAVGSLAPPSALLRRCPRRLRGAGVRGWAAPALFPDSD